MSQPEDRLRNLTSHAEVPECPGYTERLIPSPSRLRRKLGAAAAVGAGLIIALDIGGVVRSNGWSTTAPTVIVNFAGGDALQYRQCPGDSNELNDELRDIAPPLPPQGCVDEVLSVSGLARYYLAPDQLTEPGDVTYPRVHQNPVEQVLNWQRRLLDRVFP